MDEHILSIGIDDAVNQLSHSVSTTHPSHSIGVESLTFPEASPLDAASQPSDASSVPNANLQDVCCSCQQTEVVANGAIHFGSGEEMHCKVCGHGRCEDCGESQFGLDHFDIDIESDCVFRNFEAEKAAFREGQILKRVGISYCGHFDDLDKILRRFEKLGSELKSLVVRVHDHYQPLRALPWLHSRLGEIAQRNNIEVKPHIPVNTNYQQRNANF